MEKLKDIELNRIGIFKETSLKCGYCDKPIPVETKVKIIPDRGGGKGIRSFCDSNCGSKFMLENAPYETNLIGAVLIEVEFFHKKKEKKKRRKREAKNGT